MASDAANGGGWRKGWRRERALRMPFHIFVRLCSSSPRVTLSSRLDFTPRPPNITGAHFLFPFFSLLLQVVNFFFSFSLNSLHPTLPLHRGHCAACECYWFGRLQGVWPGLTHLLPGRFLSVPAQLTLRCVRVHVFCIWGCVCVFA